MFEKERPKIQEECICSNISEQIAADISAKHQSCPWFLEPVDDAEYPLGWCNTKVSTHHECGPILSFVLTYNIADEKATDDEEQIDRKITVGHQKSQQCWHGVTVDPEMHQPQRTVHQTRRSVGPQLKETQKPCIVIEDYPRGCYRSHAVDEWELALLTQDF